MWRKLDTGLLRNLNSISIGGAIGCEYQPIHGETNDIERIVLRRLQYKREFVLRVFASTTEALERIKEILGPHEFFTAAQYKLIEFTTPDKRVLATVLNKLKNSDTYLGFEISDICAEARIDLSEAYTEIPQWILIEDKLVGGFTYKNTRDERYSYLRVLHFQADRVPIMISLSINGNGSSISEGFALSDRSEIRDYLVSNSIFNDASQMEQIILKISNLRTTQTTPLTSSTNGTLITQATRARDVDQWSAEFKRFTDLVHGVKTQKSTKSLDELADKLLKRYKDGGLYKLWFHDNFHDKVRNVDDIKFFARQQRFYKDFIYNESEGFRSKLLRCLRDYLEGIIVFDFDKLIQNDQETISTLRHNLLVKRTLSPDGIDRALLVLSKYWPINDTDPSTQEPIPEANRVFVTEGHQHDIYSLISFHIARHLRPGETLESKKLINISTNNPIPDLNAHYIFEMALTHPATKHFKLPQHLNQHRLSIADIQTGPLISTQTIIFFKDGNLQRRFMLLEPHLRTRLAMNMKIGWTSVLNDTFINGLLELITQSISIEAFAALDTERQKILAYGRVFPQILGHGIEPVKLLSLSANNLRDLEEMVTIMNHKLPTRTFPGYDVDDQFIDTIKNKIDQRLAAQLVAQESFYERWAKPIMRISFK
jgi:hypothetical protein